MRSLIGWIRSWFATIERGKPEIIVGSIVYPVLVNGKPVRLAFSHERMMDMGQMSGIDAETAVIILIRCDIFAATGILFSERRIRKAGR